MKLIPEVGDTVTVQAKSLYDLCFNIKGGGTHSLKPGTKVEVVIIKAWEDPECGWTFHGVPLQPCKQVCACGRGMTMRGNAEKQVVMFREGVKMTGLRPMGSKL